jgi:diguanylate cyclase (GGDEF)-like protein
MAETAVMAPSVADAALAAQLARVWLTALGVSENEKPAGRDDLPIGSRFPTDMETASARAFFAEQSAALLSILLGEPFRPRWAAAVGHALVKADFVGADVLGRSLRVLMLRLPEALLRTGPGRLADAHYLDRRVAAVTEALANGYVRALRDRTLAEQESIRHAELDAQRLITDRLRHQATHDPLTGLPNRAAVFGRLADALQAGPDTSVGLMYLDLDGFKGINDRHGHEAGDELLVTVARRIGELAAARGAVAGRIGGDEFVVVAEVSPGIPGMTALAAGIIGAVSRPIPLRIGPVRVSACAGIAECAAGSPAAATITADADAALYQAKARGPGKWAVHGGIPPVFQRRQPCRPPFDRAAVHPGPWDTARPRDAARP